MKVGLRTALVNLAVLLVLLGLIILTPPAILDGYKAATARPDARAALPNYQGMAWAGKHFEEFNAQRTIYADFIGWRRAPFAGDTITVDSQGYRRHQGSGEPEGAAVWIFGGSTVWGPGVRDEMTLPATIQASSGRPTFNFGESAYTAHQSYNLLIKRYLAGGRPQQVVFYDGANEVVIKCRAELGFFSAAQEVTIRERLRGVSDGASMTLEVFWPALQALRRLSQKLAGPTTADSPATFDCHTNELKRQRIAAALVLDWQLARQLVESRGGRFLAVLQPVAFTGQPALGHLPGVRSDALLRAQYDAVYGEIIKQLSDAAVPYADLRTALDSNGPLYIDFAHVSPPGNQIVGQRIADLLK